MDIVFQPSALLDWCQRIYGPGQRLLLTDYSYPVNFGAVAANSRNTKQLQITQNADFVMLGVNYAFYDNALDAVTNATILISDSATGEQFSNTEIYLNNLCAIVYSGNNPLTQANLPYPRWIGGNSVLNLQFNSDDSIDGFTLMVNGFLVRKLA